MKKSLFIILMVCLALVGFVSCKNEIEPMQEELVSISFEEGASRALSATLESFDKGNYYWKYAAKKADTSNLISGQTANYDVVNPTETSNREAGAQWVNEGHAGLGSGSGTSSDPYVAYKVQGFSQGLWNFTLFAYKNVSTTETPDYKLVYQGETTGVLITAGTNGSHSVNVVVSPVQSGNGTISVLITGDNKITLNPATPLPEQVLANAKIQLGIDKLGTTTPTVIRELSFIDEDYSNNDLEPGTYKVSVQFTNDDATVVYASGSVVATVYSGLTTTVSGSLSEVITYIDFTANQNPDIITKTAGVDGIHKNDDVSDAYTLTEKNVAPANARVSASVPAAAAKNLLPKDSEQQIIADASMSLELNVDTKDSTSTSVTYEISMTKIVTLNSEVTTSDVPSLGTYLEGEAEKKYYAVATIKLSPGLTGVTVTHDGHAMVESTSTTADEGYGVYSYDAEMGILTIQTNTFSPFEVKYNASAVAAIGSALYKTLADAVAAVPTDGTETTITMIKNTVISGNAGVTIPATKNVVLDLNGYTVKNAVNEDKASQVIKNEGILTIKDSSVNGTGLLTNGIEEGTNPGEWWSTPQYNYATNVITNTGTLTIESGTILQTVAGSICYAVDNNSSSNNAVLNVKGGLLTDSYGTAVRMFCNSTVKNNIINMTGGEISTPGKTALWIQLPGSGGQAKKATLNVSGGRIIGGTYSFYDYTYGDVYDSVSYTVSGGYFEGWIYSYNEGYTFITGGTYTKDPSDYVAEGYKAVEGSGVWNVVPITAEDEVYVAGSSYSGARYMTLGLFRNRVNDGTDYSGCTIKLQRNIDLTNVAWTPIGTTEHPFNGFFDGQGYTISNLSYNGAPTDQMLGLFGEVKGTQNSAAMTLDVVWNDSSNYINEESFDRSKYTAGIINLVISGFDITNTSSDGSNRYTGALAGRMDDAYIENITVGQSTIEGKKGIGGLVGSFNGSTAKNCQTLLDVSVSATDGGYNVGGLFGGTNYSKNGTKTNYGAIISCVNKASVTIPEYGETGGYIGGIVGMSQNWVAGNSTTDSGYFIVNCTNEGAVEAETTVTGIGGIAGFGHNVHAFVGCENTGAINANTVSEGISGISYGGSLIYNSSNSGSITASAAEMAGVFIEYTGQTVGFAFGCSNTGILTNSNKSGAIAQIAIVGGIITAEGIEFADVNEVYSFISNNNCKNISFINCTVADKTGELDLSGISVSIYSDEQLCTTVKVSDGNVALNIPNVSVVVPSVASSTLAISSMGAGCSVTVKTGAAIQNVTIGGNGSNLTVEGSVSGNLIFAGEGAVSGTISSGATVGHVGFGGTGTYTLTNEGTISHTHSEGNPSANEHTVSTIKACAITINNKGLIAARANTSGRCSYAMLFYNGCDVIVNQYPESSIVADVNGYLLACGSANSVVYNTCDINGAVTGTVVKK